MRRCDAAGEQYPGDAYVFGDAVGRQVKSVRPDWQRAREKAGLGDFHLADLRHEAASRFEEFGVPTLYVSQFLGHSNLSTTTRYLNSTRRGLHWAMERFETVRKEKEQEAKAAKQKTADVKEERRSTTPAVAQTLHNEADRPSDTTSGPTRRSQPKSLVS